jgi:short-subunit dehydrogenase
MELQGKLVVLTGASRGIGRALAKKLAKVGCSLLVTAVENDELNTLVDEIKGEFSVEVTWMVVDLSDFEARIDLISWIKNHERPIDVLINNAGFGGYFGRFEYFDWKSIEKTIAMNVSAFTHITHELIPVLKKRPRAKIVNISSGIARFPYPGLSVYGATKGYVSSLSESLACELCGTNIDTLCFHPGFTITPFITNAKMDISKIPKIMIHKPEKVAERIVKAIQEDKQWAYSDFLTRFSAWFGALLPARLKTYIFKDLFWVLPDAK